MVAGAVAIVKAADESCGKASLFSSWRLFEIVREPGAIITGFFWRRNVIVDGATG